MLFIPISVGFNELSNDMYSYVIEGAEVDLIYRYDAIQANVLVAVNSVVLHIEVQEPHQPHHEPEIEHKA